MKFLGLCLSLLLFSFAGFAQGEFTPKMTPILPASPNTAPNRLIVAPKAPSLFDVKPENKSIPFPEAPKSIFAEKEKFVDANKPYADKMNKKEGNVLVEATRKDQYYGDFKTKSESVNIQYRDFGAVDGDVIKIYVNDNIVRASVTLAGDFRGFKLPLQPGFNKIEFEALNVGYSFPNTAEFEIYDDKGVRITSNTWNLSTGYKASLIVVKQ